MVPVVGSPIAVAFAVAMGWTFNKRMTIWLDDLAVAVDELQQQAEAPLTFEDLATDEGFVDAVVNATRAAQATHQQEKLDALRNGVLNSIGTSDSALDEQARFFRLVEEFSTAHLTLLTFLNDPGGWFDQRGIEKPNIHAGARATLLEAAIPEFAGRRDWYDLLAGDLSSARLIDANLHATMTGPGAWSSCLRPLGVRFLEFVTDPR